MSLFFEVILLDQLLKLLDLLSFQRYQSGQLLARKLGVSRASISSWVAKLIELGIEINTVKGRGYRLVNPVSLIEKDRAVSLLSDTARAQISHINVTTETKSTNEDALGRAQEGAGAWQVFATELQSQGKGRRGRVWQSPFAQNLMFSLGRKTHVSTEMLYSASLIAGVAVVDALNLHSDIQFRLKWPNDIYVDGKKLGGILCEMQGNPLDEPLLVIGVGINVNAHPDNLDYPACSLKSLGVKNSDRTVLLASLVEQLVLMFSQDGPEYVAEVLVRWQDFDILKDRAVTIVQGPNVSHGVARGIDIKGQLVVEDESGRKKSLNGGEVSVKWC